MGRLPELPYADGITRSVQRVFGGYQHTPGSYDGTLYDMENLCADEYPLLAVRKPRVTVGSAEHCNGCVAVGERFCYVDGENVYLDGRLVGTAADSPKTFGVLGNRLLIFPDKLFLNLSAGEVFSSLAALTAAVADPVYGEVYGVTSDVAADLYFWNGDNWAFLEKEFATMEPTVTAEAVFLARGTLYGEPAVRNGIYAPGVLWADYFAPGDAVTVRGCAREENNLTAVIREIDGNCLYFYEYLFEVDTAWVYRVENILAAGTYAFAVNDVTRSFTLNTALKSGDALCWNGTTLTARAGDRETVLPVAEGSGGTLLAFLKGPADATETAVTVTRVVPDLEFLCSANNRLWGCAGDTVYGSKLGDPFNFNVFDGLATDSYTAESGTPGPFTACCSYLGYPTFLRKTRFLSSTVPDPPTFLWWLPCPPGWHGAAIRVWLLPGKPFFTFLLPG